MVAWFGEITWYGMRRITVYLGLVDCVSCVRGPSGVGWLEPFLCGSMSSREWRGLGNGKVERCLSLPRAVRDRGLDAWEGETLPCIHYSGVAWTDHSQVMWARNDLSSLARQTFFRLPVLYPDLLAGEWRLEVTSFQVLCLAPESISDVANGKPTKAFQLLGGGFELENVVLAIPIR